MKNIKRIGLLILFVFMFLPIYCKAETVVLKTPQTVSKGDKITVDVVLSTEVTVTEFKGTISFESNVLELSSIEEKDNWKQQSKFSKESPISIVFNRENGVTGDTTIASLQFIVKSDVTKTNTMLSIEGTYKTQDDETINTLEKSISNIDIKSTDNTLKSIKINGSDVDNFSKNVYSYKQIVDSSVFTVNFDAELNDSTATFKEGYEPQKGASLNYGENVFDIIVISASGAELKYSVTIIREDNRGTNNSLSELIINSNKKLLNFRENTLNYTITTHKLETVDVTATPSDPKATVKIDKPEKLVIGPNEIKITVTSEKNESKVYTIIVNNSDKDVDTSLKSLDVFGLDGEIDFQKNIYEYEVLYKSKYTGSLVINPTVNNPDEAEVYKEGYENDIAKLKADGKVTIEVRSKDGDEKATSFYTITFKKDTRINFFLILGLIIFTVLLIIFIKLFIRNKKQKQEESKNEEELAKTKRLEKVVKE